MIAERKKILVVDDEPSICEILDHFLSRNGYDVVRANDGIKALGIVREGNIDLVVSDIKMPGMSGVELLQKIRGFNHTIPVLITTGFPTLDTAIEALKCGAYDYLTKPFHLEEISEKIKRALAQRVLEEQNSLLKKVASLHEVTKILASTREAKELNAKFLDFSVRISQSDGAALVFSETSPELTPQENNILGETFRKDFWPKDDPIVMATRWVIENQVPVVIETKTTDLPDGLRKIPPEISSFVSFPLKTPSRTIGVLNLARVSGRESFSDLELELITVLSSQASISIDNLQLDSQIRDNYTATITAFAKAVEFKDEYTRNHSNRVQEYSVMIAQHLNLPPNDVEFIKYAGLLHDIGKIGVSKAILTKPDKLTNEEYDEIKKHPELGAKIIVDVPFLKSLYLLILHHHEFFDGSKRGYPKGISGEAIPLGARILSVADAYDAMTSKRSYRDAMPQETAIRILEEEKGRQFDPHIVDAFVRILRTKDIKAQ
ncbi:MAG: response regulator [Chitinispirillaceae bacterium]|jgi:putative nucleotidyltransferase with HDIG domain|nr:response regulator [Chitinispirillaceae bacterium]